LEAADLREQLEEAHEKETNTKRFANIVALVITLTSMVFVFNQSGGENADMDFLENHVAASDDFNYVQARNIDNSVNYGVMEMLEVLAPILPAEQRPAVMKLIEGHKGNISYNNSNDNISDPHYPNGTGRTQLLASAREKQATREEARKKGDNFDFGGKFIQLAMGLGAAAFLAVSAGAMTAAWVLLGISALMSALGGLYTLNGYQLLWELPLELLIL